MAMDTANEGKLTEKIESQTAKVPSLFFLKAAVALMGISAALKCCNWKDDKDALFIGQWVAPFLLLGIYNKIVKTAGHD
ncbi:hypothetical protein HP439_13340 [Sphingobacterium shayense]|uniref:hypothetical protein n=1 Tax=Sphingobacterium shayense TaxID=626343 RepID=UPI0015548CA2|nr:hypothetical protein [Sphingobacterium shayense]NQD71708.1 hypothetical protein [Sphingobacterium shayense]